MKVIVIGATGAVGTHMVLELLSHEQVTQITLLLRRIHENEKIKSSPKVIQHIVDVFNPLTYGHLLKDHDIAFSTFGVGQPSKVSEKELLETDYEAVKNFAFECKKNNISHFSALVAVGADSKSRINYLRIKGMLEEALIDLKFNRCSLFEPSMIITPQNRYGVSQGIALRIFPLIDQILIPPISQYRSIKVEKLGRAMALNAFIKKEGAERLVWKDFKRILKS